MYRVVEVIVKWMGEVECDILVCLEVSFGVLFCICKWINCV